MLLAEAAGVGEVGMVEGLQGGAQPGEDVPEFDADWGLETLVNVGEHWITNLLQVSHSTAWMLLCRTALGHG